MLVIRVDRVSRVDGPFCAVAFQFPCCLCIPTFVVVSGVFKVAVLNEFGIQSTVGSIADVLKEDAVEVRRNGFTVGKVDVNGRGKVFGEF